MTRTFARVQLHHHGIAQEDAHRGYGSPRNWDGVINKLKPTPGSIHLTNAAPYLSGNRLRNYARVFSVNYSRYKDCLNCKLGILL